MIARWNWVGSMVLVAGALAALMPAGCSKPMSEPERRDRIEALYRQYRQSFPATPHMTAKELVSARATEPILIVDVREPGERAVSMIPGAVTAEQFEKDRGSARKGTIVVYCTIGYRSGLYAKKLREDGFRTRNLKGGILSWVHAGRQVVDKDGPTRRVHVYGAKWDLLPDGYQAVW